MADYRESIIATFTDLDAANKALRRLREAQQKRGLELSEGAVVVGTADGVVSVTDIEDFGLGDVTSSTVDLLMFLGVGTMKIAAEAAISGGALLLNSARRAAALGSSILLLPARMVMDMFDTEAAIEALGGAIGPGVCAVVAVVRDPSDAAQIIAELAESGGEVIELDIEAEVTEALGYEVMGAGEVEIDETIIAI